MAKPIFVPHDEAVRIIEAVRAQIFNQKCYGKLDIQQSFKGDNRKAKLCFTPTAWVKMTSLVSEFSTEVQWHGLVRRISDCEYEVYDIIVPPHTVTAATVTSDQERYANWINGLDDDVFNALRFHGHSHVNMAVTPSVTDTDYRKDVVTQLPKSDENNDTFYIFLIINKSHKWSAEIFDLTNNALYSTDDKNIELKIALDSNYMLDEFVAEAKSVAVQATYTAPTANTSVSGGKQYGSYSGGSKPATPANNSYGGTYGGAYGTYGGTYGGSYGGSTGYSKTTDKSKKADSVKDDDDDYYGVNERPSDPFYARDAWEWR